MGDIDLKVISVTENSNKFQKTKVLKGKFSWECGNIWRLTIQFKHDLAVQKIDTYIANQCSHIKFPYFVMGSHLGQWHRPHQFMLKSYHEDEVHGGSRQLNSWICLSFHAQQIWELSRVSKTLVLHLWNVIHCVSKIYKLVPKHIHEHKACVST